jgi:hypothetical protein
MNYAHTVKNRSGYDYDEEEWSDDDEYRNKGRNIRNRRREKARRQDEYLDGEWE